MENTAITVLVVKQVFQKLYDSKCIIDLQRSKNDWKTALMSMWIPMWI